jgi:GH24 family phage-related lysozyme (muramidase)
MTTVAIWPKDNDAALNAFYSRPDGSAKWEVTNLVYITCPWKCYLAGTKTEMLRGIRVHKKVAESLKAVFADIWVQCGKSQKEIEKHDLHQIGGAYYFRARRGSPRLSNHARGIAIDIDPLDNVMRKGNKGDMAAFVILTFQRHGWKWGGEYGDPMHFEAVYSDVSDRIAKSWLINPVVPKPVKVVPDAKAAESTAKWTIPQAAVDIVKFEESFMGTVYDDRGHWAYGYGHTAKLGLPSPQPGMTITEPEASKLLASDMTKVVGQVMPLIKVSLTPNQLGAIASFVYNVGQSNFGSSTMLKKINAGDFVGASEEFKKWNKSTNPKTQKKEVLAGLTRRREKERVLFVTP